MDTITILTKGAAFPPSPKGKGIHAKIKMKKIMPSGIKNQILLSGSSHVALASQVAKELNTSLGKANCFRFPDREVGVEVQVDVRGMEVFIFQTCVFHPNRFFMELLLLIDAVKRAGAKSIVPVLSYYPYGRQDRVVKEGEPIAARVVAKCLEEAGANKIILFDLHQGQLEGFFNIPVLHLTAQKVFIPKIASLNLPSLIMVSPDVGSGKITHAFSKELMCDFAIIDKHRFPNNGMEMRLIGKVKGHQVVIADDICSTASTMIKACELCHEQGATEIYGAVTHALFDEKALDRLKQAPFKKIFVSDTIPIKGELNHLIEVVSIAPLLAKGVLAVKEG